MSVIKIIPVCGNYQKLDGGAMFGHVPKAMWEKWEKPDEQNRIDLACRAMLVVTDKVKILVETGIGNFFPEKMRQRFGVFPDTALLIDNLSKKGISHEEIDFVFLSHLHFDHAGGLIKKINKDSPPELYFPKAKYLVSKSHWERALNPHPRDKASFIDGLCDALLNSGRLELLDENWKRPDTLNFLSWRISNGHTPGLCLPTITGENDAITFMGDLIPGSSWLHIPIAMAYDRYPEMINDEKLSFYKDIGICGKRQWLFYTHDSKCAFSEIIQDDKGKYQAHNKHDDESILLM